jgi:hypothetical protein
MLFAPGLVALALTALVAGKTGLRALWSRMTRWRVDLRWYALAVVALPLLVLIILYMLGALLPNRHASRTVHGRDEPKRSSSRPPQTSHPRPAGRGNSERITSGRLWPGTGFP